MNNQDHYNKKHQTTRLKNVYSESVDEQYQIFFKRVIHFVSPANKSTCIEVGSGRSLIYNNKKIIGLNTDL